MSFYGADWDIDLCFGLQEWLWRDLAVDHEGLKPIRRACSRSILPRPYIWRLISFSLVT